MMRGERPVSKRRRDDESFAQPPLHNIGTNTFNRQGDEAADDTPPARLSRHIPHRQEMNMAVSSFNLTSRVPNPSIPHLPSSHSFAMGDSYVSDDSGVASSLYCERLADSLVQGSSKLGGDVLHFGAEKNSQGLREMNIDPSRLQHHSSRPVRANHRILNSNPDRVLDAPELPAFPSAQLLDWGSNDKIVLGLRSTLYGWDAKTQQSQKAAELPAHMIIRCVQWIYQCCCVAITVTDGTTAILDTRVAQYIRSLDPPGGGSVSQIACEGAMLAAASNTSSGIVYLYDLRAKNALAAQYEGHKGRVASLSYCPSDPHYLASGGSDGAVRIWDARKPGFPRYSFQKVHSGAVTALLWNPDKRTTFFSGGEDRNLILADTHGNSSTDSTVATTGLERPFMLKSVHTFFPISGILCPGGQGEIATSHYGTGQIQLRKLSTFQQIGTFSAPNCEAGISCMTLAPDKERVCAAQQDETLKFWRVFDNSSLKNTKQKDQPMSMLDETLR